MQRAYSNKSRSTSLTDRSNDILSHDRIAFQALKGAPVAAGVSAGPLPPSWTMMLMGLVVFGFQRADVSIRQAGEVVSLLPR